MRRWEGGHRGRESVRQALAGELVPDAVNVEGGNIEEPVRRSSSSDRTH